MEEPKGTRVRRGAMLLFGDSAPPPPPAFRWHGTRLLLPGPGSAAALGFNHAAIEAQGAPPGAEWHAVGNGLKGEKDPAGAPWTSGAAGKRAS